MALSGESKVAIDHFATWSKLQRERLLKDVNFEATSYRENRLVGNSYNANDVSDLLSGQLQLLLASTDRSDQLRTTATVDMCRLIFAEADRNMVPLAGLGAGVQQALLNCSAGSGSGGDQKMMAGPKGKLAPLSASDATGEAAKRLADAHDEIRRLREKMQVLQGQLNATMGDKSSTTAQMLGMHDTLLTSQAEAERARAAAVAAGTAATVAPSAPRGVETVTKTVEVTSAADKATIASLRGEVALLTKDLSAKLNQSPQFINLRKMLTDKNAQVQKLRKRLLNFDPAFVAALGGGNDDDLVEEED